MSAKSFESKRREIRKSYDAAVRELYVRSPDPHGSAVKHEHKLLVAAAVRELQQVRREVVQEEKEIRARYAKAMGGARSKSHAVQATIWGRSAAGTARADEKRAIGRKRDKELEPYGRVKLAIDNGLRLLRDVKDGLA